MKSIQKQTINRRRGGAISIWIAAATIGLFVSAPGMHADDAQPAARAVHLSYVEGQVRVTQGDQVIADGATVNMPIFEGMQVSTSQDGRAEIQFDDGSVARLSPNTTLTLTVLRGAGSDGNAEMLVNGGLAYFEFEGGPQSGQTTVRFADSSVTPSGNANIRVRMDAPPGELAILSGNANLNRGNGGLQLAMHGGESVTLYANDINRYDLNESIDPDSWDAWNTDRDEAMATESAAFTAPEPSQNGPESGSPAWSDLDANGNWYNVPGQGFIWSPFAASGAGWDPYGCGRWVWYPRFGYTYVPCDSWGFLPYSCGSWNFFNDFGWGWSPGMGGCNPWWNSYGYYPGPRFGGLPPGYRLPRRPILPRGTPPGRPAPVVAVNRPPISGGNPFPIRERNTPVPIGGRLIEPMHPVLARGGEPRTASAAPRPSFSVFDGGAKGDASGGRPAYSSPTSGGASSTYRGSAVTNTGAGSRGSTAPVHTGSSGGSSHGASGGSSYHATSSGGGASHVSSGGGGGGGSHGGGGGGGGGGSHK